MASYKPTQKDFRKYMIDARRRLVGDKCEYCGRSLQELQKYFGTDFEFLREHVNGDPNDWDIDNIRLSCNSCNQHKREDHAGNGKKSQQPPLSGGKSEREIAGAYAQTNDDMTELSAEQRRKKRQLENAPLELKKSIDCTPKVRRYVWEQYARLDGLLYSDAINEAAEYAACDVQTAKRKIDPMTSRAGPFKLVPVGNGDDYLIQRRDNYRANPHSELGRLDIALAIEIASKAEIEKKRVQDDSAMVVSATRAEMRQTQSQADRLAKQRDFLIRQVMQSTGKTYEQVFKELRAAGLVNDDFADDSMPAAPVIKNSGGDPPAAGAAESYIQ